MSSHRSLRSLATSSALYAGARFLLSGSKLLLLPVLVRFLSPEQYGIVGTATTIAGVLTVVLFIGIERAVAREYFDYRDDPPELRSYLVTVCAFVLTVSVGGAALLWIAGPALIRFFLPRAVLQFYPYGPLVLGIAVVTGFHGIVMILLQVREQARSYVTAQVVRFLIATAVTLGLVVGCRQGAVGVLTGELVGTGTVAIVLAVSLANSLFTPTANAGATQAAGAWESAPARIRRTYGLSRRKLRNALAYSLPFIPSDMFSWAMGTSDRLILARYRTMGDVGIYTVGASLASGLNMLTSATHMAYVPYYFKAARDEATPREAFAQVTELFLLVVGGIGLAAMLFAREAVALVATRSFGGAATVIPVLLLATLASGLYSMTMLPYYERKRTAQLPVFTALSAAVNVGLNLLLVPRFGIAAAAWSSLAAQAVLLLLATRGAAAFYRIPYSAVRLWGVLALFGSCGLLFASKPTMVRLAVFVCALGAAVYANRVTLRNAMAEPSSVRRSV